MVVVMSMGKKYGSKSGTILGWNGLVKVQTQFESVFTEFLHQISLSWRCFKNMKQLSMIIEYSSTNLVID